MAVEAPRLDEQGEGLLVEPGCAATAQLLLLGESFEEAGRREDPADPDRRRDRLADGAEREHPLRIQSLKGSDGLSVVAELGVVVILQDHAVDLVGPRNQLAAARRAESHPGGALVCRRDQDGTCLGRTERGHVQSLGIDRDRHGLETGALGDDVVLARAGIFQADDVDARSGEGREGEGQTLAEAADHDGVVRGRASSSHATVIGRHDLAQVTRAGWFFVSEPGGRQRSARLTHRPDPVAQRNRAEIGDAVLEVDRGLRPSASRQACRLVRWRRSAPGVWATRVPEPTAEST